MEKAREGESRVSNASDVIDVLVFFLVGEGVRDQSRELSKERNDAFLLESDEESKKENQHRLVAVLSVSSEPHPISDREPRHVERGGFDESGFVRE